MNEKMNGILERFLAVQRLLASWRQQRNELARQLADMDYRIQQEERNSAALFRRLNEPRSETCTWSPDCPCDLCRASVEEMHGRGQRNMLA
jgi:hypothetical protein